MCSRQARSRSPGRAPQSSASTGGDAAQFDRGASASQVAGPGSGGPPGRQAPLAAPMQGAALACARAPPSNSRRSTVRVHGRSPLAAPVAGRTAARHVGQCAGSSRRHAAGAGPECWPQPRPQRRRRAPPIDVPQRLPTPGPKLRGASPARPMSVGGGGGGCRPYRRQALAQCALPSLRQCSASRAARRAHRETRAPAACLQSLSSGTAPAAPPANRSAECSLGRLGQSCRPEALAQPPAGPHPRRPPGRPSRRPIPAAGCPHGRRAHQSRR